MPFVGQTPVGLWNRVKLCCSIPETEMTMGQRVKWVKKSEWVTWVSTRDPSLTHDQVNKTPRTGCFVAVMMFDFLESTSTQWSWLETAIVGSHDSWVVVSHGSIDWWVTWVTGQKVWPIVISAPRNKEKWNVSNISVFSRHCLHFFHLVWPTTERTRTYWTMAQSCDGHIRAMPQCN